MDDTDVKVQRKIRSRIMKIDRSICIGAATCIAIAPRAWALDNEAKAIILDSSEDETDEVLLDAAKSCPVAAISIIDELGNRLFP